MEDLDGPKTVADKVARQAKIRVFKQFSYGVVAYVATTLAVILLPIFVSPAVCAPPPPGTLPPVGPPYSDVCSTCARAKPMHRTSAARVHVQNPCIGRGRACSDLPVVAKGLLRELMYGRKPFHQLCGGQRSNFGTCSPACCQAYT